MFKKIFMLVMFMSFVLLLSSCKEDQINVSILLYNSSDTYISSLNDELLKDLPESYNVNDIDCQNSQSIQTTEFLNVLDTTDIFLINIYDRANAKDIIMKVKATTNAPIVFFNREVSLEDMKLVDNAYYVGCDSENAGQIQAELFDQTYKQALLEGVDFDKNQNGKIETVVLKGENQHQDAENRTKFSLDTLTELGYDINTQSISNCDWSRSIAYNSAKKIMSENSDVELVISNNDDMALGFIDYLKEVRIFSNSYSTYAPIQIIGFDGTTAGQDSISLGLLTGSVLNDAYKQAKLISSLTQELLSGETVINKVLDTEVVNERFFYSENIMITRDSIV